MLKEIALTLSIGLVFAFGSAEPISKTTSAHSVHPPTITTPLGDVKGTILTSRLGKTIYSFRGLRYAKAPINELRFQPPTPIEKWDSIFNATQDGAPCPQSNIEQTSEDCLFLNIYTTKLVKGNDNPKRPVIVFLHDGNFYSSSSSSAEMGPQYLLDQEIVLVVPNYRLGALGFLSTSEKDFPGNYGLKDQVQVLKWVKENIAAFGGNPESVTIAGYGAGGVSVSVHLVSPLSKGLFHKAIVMSGSVYGNWPLVNNQMELAKKQAKLVNCPVDTVKNMMQCIKTKSADDLVKSTPGFKELGDDPLYYWSPVIEADFLPSHPIELINKGEFNKVPVLAGVTADEFGGRAYTLIANETALNELAKDFEKNSPISFHYEKNPEVAKTLKTVYFEDKPIDKSQIPGFAQLYTDSLVGFNINRMMKVLAEKNDDLFYYHFNFKGKYSNCYLPDSNNTVPYGASHQDDLLYLFSNSNFAQFKEGEVELSTIEKMTKLWANFAIHGNPIHEPCEKLDNVKWEKFSTKNQKFMDIGNKLAMSENLHEKRYKEWEKLYPLSKYSNAQVG
ncbi:juvenile hormone esterase-like [Onthophagus taurus]|uniref:juvenile hormone esterase-like n=1 Tax=Onthophagus taurus TaxID=166361 RepID=UPI0039BE7171